MQRIAQDPTHVLMPMIDGVNQETFEVVPGTHIRRTDHVHTNILTFSIHSVTYTLTYIYTFV